MRARPYTPWIVRLYLVSVTGLAVTGLLHMPLAERYALTEVPGLGWTGDFYLVHRLHYLFAALLLFTAGLSSINWLLGWKDRLALTRLGAVRVAILGGLMVSGGLRMYRNLPSVTLDPVLVVLIEWVHLGLAGALGVAVLAAALRGGSAYVRWR
ncbi:4Fe-4S ferredoxin [Pseudodesulfovibrio sp. F-1]|uniref:4Fe-4S ferredoxin n=1 Tax=Pseudodesulfovibrio alkaliphilus TaxID=2661613 RepID=A0A7K1KPK1_9BACT|nr:4Fe-4S ferredoxin [Pseudodesulfovibrio alkaliphilus]MUM78008.1 4Fe-4S ferredoxin [Pseudodesulfovibrio alkaliphilus]